MGDGVNDAPSRIAREQITPYAAEVEDRDARYPSEALQVIREQGFFGSLYPEEYGGTGLSASTTVRVTEAFAEVCANAANVIATQGLGALPLVLAGSEEQKARYLPPLARGDQLAAFALTEPEAGSDAGGIGTKAVPDGDGWTLNGNK